VSKQLTVQKDVKAENEIASYLAGEERRQGQTHASLHRGEQRAALFCVKTTASLPPQRCKRRAGFISAVSLLAQVR